MKLLLFATLVLLSKFALGSTLADDDSSTTSPNFSCDLSSNQNATTFVLELNTGQVEVTGQTLMGLAYSYSGFFDYINPMLTGSAHHIQHETRKAFKAIVGCYAKFPTYNYTFWSINDDGAIIARAAAEGAKTLKFPTSERQFRKTFQILDGNTLVEFVVSGKIESVAYGKGHNIKFHGVLAKHRSPSPEFVSFQGYLYVDLVKSGSLETFDGVVQVCNGTDSEAVGIGGVLTYDVVVPPNQGLVDPAGVEGYILLPKIPPNITAEVQLDDVTGKHVVVVNVGNDTKYLDAATVEGFVNADLNFQSYFYSLSFGQGSDIALSTYDAYLILSNCKVVTSK